MEARKWLKRKYPESFKELDKFFNEGMLDFFKSSTHKVGRLIKDINVVGGYKKGDIFIFKRTNPINSYNYPIVYATFKCKKTGLTVSGYHSIDLVESDFKEITK